MKHVTFIKPMAPHHAGDRRLLPEAVARRLEAEGLIEANPPDWPERAAPAASDAPAPKRRVASYMTKG